MVKKRPPIFSQVDKQWKMIKYGTDTIGFAGCALCAMASAVVGLTGKKVTPVDMKDLSIEHHDKVEAGTSWSFFGHASVHYKLKCHQTEDFSLVLAALKDPNSYVVASMKPGDFTTRGHFILLVGMDEKHYIILNDSAGLVGAKRSKQVWPHAKITSQAKQYWIISK